MTGIHVGATEETVKSARAAILNIMAAPRGDEVVRAALDAFVKVCNVSDVTIHDCVITVKERRMAKKTKKAVKKKGPKAPLRSR